MSIRLKKPWYSDSKVLVRKVDHWLSRRNTRSEFGQESDWLGWDGWVRADSDPRETRETSSCGRGRAWFG